MGLVSRFQDLRDFAENQDALEVLARAQEALKSGRYEEAVAQYSELIRA